MNVLVCIESILSNFEISSGYSSSTIDRVPS